MCDPTDFSTVVFMHWKANREDIHEDLVIRGLCRLYSRQFMTSMLFSDSGTARATPLT